MIPLDSRRTAKPCPFKAFRSPLTPVFPTLARTSLNLRVFYRFPATGGRVPPVYPERERRVNLPRLLTVDCRPLAVCEFWATSSISFISPRSERQPRMSLVSPTYAKTGGGGMSSQSSLLRSLPFRSFPQKCRRADILDFSPDFSHILASGSPPARLGRRRKAAPTKEAGHGSRDTGNDFRATRTHHSSPVAGHRPLATSSAILWSGHSANSHRKVSLP
jgi:hypothetical protein